MQISPISHWFIYISQISYSASGLHANSCKICQFKFFGYLEILNVNACGPAKLIQIVIRGEESVSLSGNRLKDEKTSLEKEEIVGHKHPPTKTDKIHRYRYTLETARITYIWRIANYALKVLAK